VFKSGGGGDQAEQSSRSMGVIVVEGWTGEQWGSGGEVPGYDIWVYCGGEG